MMYPWSRRICHLNMSWNISHPSVQKPQRRFDTGLNRFVLLQDLDTKRPGTALPIPEQSVDPASLTRVTAFSTANRYNFVALTKSLIHRSDIILKHIDECIYVQYVVNGSRKEVFYFDYGVFVAWGLTEDEEWEVADSLEEAQEEKLAENQVEMEQLYVLYDSKYFPGRIYNDRIMLPAEDDDRIKMAISHAIAQSAELSYFERWVETTISSLNHIPKSLEKYGKVKMKRSSIIKATGILFNVVQLLQFVRLPHLLLEE